jgi:hypothetical protein
VLAIGIEELERSRQGRTLRAQYISLAAFPPDQLIRYDTLQNLWASDRLETRSACDRFADRSLLGGSEAGGIRLHDVVRDQLLVSHRREIYEWSQRLLAVIRRPAGRGWHELPDAEVANLDQLAFLLVSTDNEHELRDLLFDLRFLVRRLRHGGVAVVGADIAVCSSGFVSRPHPLHAKRRRDPGPRSRAASARPRLVMELPTSRRGDDNTG